jgi:hypothetical protein
MSTNELKVACKVESSAVRDFNDVTLKMLTIDAAFRAGLPEGDPLREAIKEAKWAVIHAGRLLSFATDPELAKMATPELLYGPNSTPKD